MASTEINSGANAKETTQRQSRTATQPSQGSGAVVVGGAPTVSLDTPGKSLAEVQAEAAENARRSGQTSRANEQDARRAADAQALLDKAASELAAKRAANRAEKAEQEKQVKKTRQKKAKDPRSSQKAAEAAKAAQAASLESAVAEEVSRLAEPVANDDASVSDDLVAQPATAADRLGAVGTETGELLDLTPGRAGVPVNDVEPAAEPAPEPAKKPSKKKAKRKKPAAQAPAPAVQKKTNPLVGSAQQSAANRPIHLSAEEVAAGSRDGSRPSEDGDAPNTESQQPGQQSKQQPGQQSEPAAEETVDPNATTPPVNDDIFGWQQIPERIFKKGYKAISRFLEKQERNKYKRSVKHTAEVGGPESARVDKHGRADDGISYEDLGSDESTFKKKLREARDAMRERFYNASLLHIGGERIEVVTENGIHYAKRVYSKDVTEAIGVVARTYNINIRSVMRLVMLRAGLGVDYHGKIANVDPNKFSLSEQQFIELCRDICKSQDLYGHPMGIVDGSSGGVRDDSGKFVVVANTRCFPLGYIPKQLIREMSSKVGSPWYGKSATELQDMMKREWLENTYPDLCRNTTGNLMFQALAIENMMRTFMYMDGIDPQTYGLPEIVERQTRMALDAERAVEVDGDIISANEVKRRKYNGALSRMKHRYKKKGTFRDIDGSIESEAKRRRGAGIDDIFSRVTILQQAAKAANLGVMISAVPEGMIAAGEQSAAVRISDAIFNIMDPKIAEQYRMTDALDQVAGSKEAIESREVAESLYRIGGFDAIDAFFAVEGADGRSRFRLTRSDLGTFMREMGISGSSPSISDEVRNAFKVKPGQERAFLSNARYIVDAIENGMLSTNLFKKRESTLFIRLSLAEMARAAAKGRESYSREQIEQWGAGRSGGEELVRSLLQTDAGREAFMTQGITGLGRKSPIEHGLRIALNKHGSISFLVRSMFDRFPEYGVNKVLQMVPFSNTISYLTSKSISGIADIVSPGGALSRVADYQVGSRLSFAEGLRKNLLYDTVMAGEKLMIAAIYCGTVMFLGGIHPPDDDDDLTNWSEWKIGQGEDAVPIKWAWWMDDISGVGFPLGTAWAIMMQDDFSEESKRTASKVFVNAIVDLNSGTAVFDAIDLLNNFDEEVDNLFGANVKGYDPDFGEWFNTTIEQGFWDLIGDLTPTMIGQLTPWSRDFLFRGDKDAHTASRVYDTGEGSKYTMEEAREGYHTRGVDSYSEYMRRRSAQTNILQALYYDAVKSDDTTGYKYTEQPLDTMVDPYIQSMYDQFYLDLDPATSDLPIEQEARQRELYARAETVCQYIDDHYENAAQAALAGFVLNPEARVNCINYCYHMMDVARQNFDERLSHGWLSNEEYQQARDDYYAERAIWQGYIYNYFQSEEIPWSLPRYVRQESDRATRYVDDEGNAMTWLDTLGPDAKAHAESYWYGNSPSLAPFSTPRSEGKGYNYETIPLWVVLDENGNPVNDVEAAYDNAEDLVVGMGRNADKNTQELYWGGQGTNMGPESDEVLHIPRGGIPTIGDRPWRAMEETFPDWLRDLDADTVAEMLGIPASLPTEGSDGGNGTDAGGGDGGDGGDAGVPSGGSQYPSYSGYYPSGGGGSYTPRIYSTPHQVYSSRPSGMSTRQPYSPQRTYLNPGFYTAGSRKSYSRQQ